MKQFKCEICGGTSIIQIDEKTYECQDCGLQYDVAEVETLIVLPQEVVEEPAELTVEEQENSQPTFDVAQELEDNFTEEVEAEQETEEFVVETYSEASPEHIEDTTIKSTESEETNNSTAIEENPQSEIVEEEANVNSIVEPEIEEAEVVVSENEDKSEETEVDEQEETVESSAIIPWYKNKKLIIPSIAGIALALVAVILLIVLLPKGNMPISDDNSSDIQSTVESSQVDSTQEPSESIVESSVSNSSKEESNKPTTNSVSSPPIASADPNVIAKVRYSAYYTGKVEEELNAYGDPINQYYYHESGKVKDLFTCVYSSGRKLIKTTCISYFEDGIKSFYCEQNFEEKTCYKEGYYGADDGHKGKLAQVVKVQGSAYDHLNQEYERYEITDYGYFDNGVRGSERTRILGKNGVFVSSSSINYDYETGKKSSYREYDSNGNVIKEIFYDENGNEIQS